MRWLTVELLIEVIFDLKIIRNVIKIPSECRTNFRAIEQYQRL